MKLLIILALGFCFCSVSEAQITTGSSKSKRKTKIETRYSATNNLTTAWIGPLRIWEPPQNSVSGVNNSESVDLMVSFNYPGKLIKTPDTVTVTILSASQGTVRGVKSSFEHKRDLSVLTEVETFHFGPMDLTGSNERRLANILPGMGISGILLQEEAAKRLPFADYHKIAQAQKIEFKVGDKKFKLKKEHIEALKNFGALMKEEGLEF